MAIDFAPRVGDTRDADTVERDAHRSRSSLRQRALESFGAGPSAAFVVALALALAASASAGEPVSTHAAGDAGTDAARAPSAGTDVAVGTDVTVAVGYAFRSVDAAVDDRAHGGAAVVGVDVGPFFRGFGARLELLALGFPARDVVGQPLALIAGGPALTYALDDGDVLAVARVGALGGAVVDGGVVSAALGGSAGLRLRFRVGAASHVDVDVVAPVVPGDARFGLQAAATLGLGVSLDRVVAGLSRGEGLPVLLLPAR